MIRTMVVCCTILLSAQSSPADTFFHDDFQDGSATNGSPVTWNDTYPPWNNGTREVVDGDYILTPSLQEARPDYWENDSNVAELVFHDFSIRTQARVLGTENGVAIGLNARDTHSQSPDGQTGHNIYAWVGTNGQIEIGTGVNSQGTALVFAQTDLRPTEYDVMLRLDVVGEEVKLWAWPADGARQTLPQLMHTFITRTPPSIFNSPGQVGIWNGQVDVDLSGVTVPVAFRYVEVVPEPSSAVLYLLGAGSACAVSPLLHKKRRAPSSASRRT